VIEIVNNSNMKQILVIFLTILFYRIGHAQGDFTLKSHVGVQNIRLNGVLYVVDSVKLTIPTNYPSFDTLVFESNAANSNNLIICNFKPDTSYSIIMVCCGSNDIIPTSKLNNDSLRYWDYEKDFDKIQNQFWDKPFISIRTKGSPQDSIYAWHADAACGTEHKVISTELWRLGVPPKCFYWNNITYIVFFKKSEINKTLQEEQTAEFLGFKNIEIMATISFRLFDNERFVIVFDEENKTGKLEYE
jgi:hypothetical protein